MLVLRSCIQALLLPRFELVSLSFVLLCFSLLGREGGIFINTKDAFDIEFSFLCQNLIFAPNYSDFFSSGDCCLNNNGGMIEIDFWSPDNRKMWNFFSGNDWQKAEREVLDHKRDWKYSWEVLAKRSCSWNPGLLFFLSSIWNFQAEAPFPFW